MNCPECSESLLDLIENELSTEETQRVNQHLANCENCQKEYQDLNSTWNSLDRLPKPGPEMKERFTAALSAYEQGQLEGRELRVDNPAQKPNIILRLWQSGYGQAAMIGFAFLVGLLVTRPANNTSDLESIKQELASIREFTALSLLSQTSVSERLRGMEWITETGIENPKTLNTLYDKLNYDPNINVRFAALETLGNFSGNPDVRQKLVEQLDEPNSPMIKAELIKLIVRNADRSSIPTLKRISEDADEHATIRELANWGITTLNKSNTENI